MANGVNPDQMMHSVVADLDLFAQDCLSCSAKVENKMANNSDKIIALKGKLCTP